MHDDTEILNGDVLLNEKERMTKAQLDALAESDTRAIPKLVEMYGTTASGFEYAELLTAAKEKSRLEAQFVSFCDKFDGAGEAWHELWGGNRYFLRPAGGKDNRSGGYIRRIREFPVKYPTLKSFFGTFAGLLPQPYDFASLQGKPHTSDSLLEDTGYAPYERWKKTVIARKGTKLLTKQVEFTR